jgi:hypothetical protein
MSPARAECRGRKIEGRRQKSGDRRQNIEDRRQTSVDGRDREYSHAAELINNLPYLAMIVLGTVVFVVSLSRSVWGPIGGGVYLIYGIAGAFWIMVFVCPYCRYWDTRACPCGYGRIAAKLRKRKATDRFNEKFKKHIPVIVPLWLIPVLTGVHLVVYSFSWLLLVLLVIFTLDAFIILPLLSVKHGCKGCPQEDTCPWMGREAKPPFVPGGGKPVGALSDCQ